MYRFFFFFQAEDGIRDLYVTGVQTCALPISPFATRVATLEPLAMNVSLYPVDGELPTLVGATDPATVLEILRDALPGANATPFVPVQCRVDVAHYPREHHCVLRYTLEGMRSNGAEAPRVTVFGKVAGNDR